MNQPLYDELIAKDYIPVETLDLEYPPDSVVIYLKNLTEQDSRVVIEFLDKDLQVPLYNQNPSIVIEDSGEATLCLSSEELQPRVETIEKVCIVESDEFEVQIDNNMPFIGNFSEVIEYLDENEFYTYPEVDCNPTYTEPLVFKNTFYDYQPDQLICLAFAIYSTDNSNIPVSYESLQVPVSNLKGYHTYSTPNAPHYNVPNNITSTYYALDEYLEALQESFKKLNTRRNIFEYPPCKGVTTKKGFIGIERYPNINIGEECTTELILNVNEVPHSFGTFTCIPNSILDARTQIYDHYTPLLLAFGFKEVKLVSHSVDLFKPALMLQLAIDTTDDLIFNVAYQPGRLKWSCSTMDWDTTVGFLWNTDCPSGVNTEEEFKDNFALTVSPILRPELNTIPSSIRLHIVTHEQAGIDLPPNGVDWLVKNNNGQEMILDSCYEHKAIKE